MINLYSSPEVRQFVPVDVIEKKIKFACENAYIRKALNGTLFDHRWTKPITFTGLDLLEILYTSDLDIFLQTYSQNYFKWKLFPVNAHKIEGHKDFLYFNSRQFQRRSIQEWEETLWHELCHIADDLSPFRFDHGDNDLDGKGDSAPVKFARYMAYVIRLPVNEDRSIKELA